MVTVYGSTGTRAVLGFTPEGDIALQVGQWEGFSSDMGWAFLTPLKARRLADQLRAYADELETPDGNA